MKISFDQPVPSLSPPALRDGAEARPHRRRPRQRLGGKLYVFGGTGGDEACLSTAEVYDPASDSWALVTSLTSPRRDVAAVAL